MADTKISNLSEASTLDGTEALPVVQTGTKKATIAQVKTYCQGSSALKANNLSDLASAATARANLGLGTAAVVDTGTAANKVVKLDGSAKLPAVDGSQLTNLTGVISGVTVKVLGGSTAGDVSGFTVSGNTYYHGIVLARAGTNSPGGIVLLFSQSPSDLTTLTAPTLLGGALDLTAFTGLTTLDLHNGTFTGLVLPDSLTGTLTLTSCSGLASMPALGGTTITSLVCAGCTSLATWSSVPSTLATLDCSSTAITSLPGSLTATALTSINCSSCTSLTTLGTMPATLTAINFSSCSVLSGLAPGTFSGCTSIATVNGSACALNQASVDAILVDLDAAGSSGGTVDLSGGSSAAPSATGAAAAISLQGKGWTVTTN